MPQATVRAFGLALMAAAAGCSNSGGEAQTIVPPSRVAAPPPPAATANVSSASSDDAGAAPLADADAAPPTQARCRAAPYDWLPPTTMGDVIEMRPAASHTPIELNLVALKFKSDGVFKTKRLSEHGTNGKLLRYQTQDRGHATEATALVTTPATSGPATFPVLLFLHGTVGMNDLCSPSRPIADSNTGGFDDPTGVLAALLASYGYVAVFPDYIGLKSFGPPSGQLHPYLVGEPTAIASLDAVRATMKFLAGSDITPGPLVVVGASQGGHAAAFVDRVAPHYAPDLPITASAWVIAPTDLEGQMHVALGGPSTTKAWANIAAFLVGAESWYAAAPQGLASAFQKPYDTLLYSALSTSCGSVPGFDGATPATVFASSLLAASQTANAVVDPFTCYMHESSLRTTSFAHAADVPAMVVLGEKDGLVNTPVERAAFQSLCASGYRLTYRECAGQDHVQTFFGSWDDWLDYLGDRIAGAPLASSCVVTPPSACSSVP